MKLSMLPDSIVICSTKKSQRRKEKFGKFRIGKIIVCNKAVPHVTSEIHDGKSLGQ